MTRPLAHKWGFAARFRRHAFGWRSQPAVQRVRQATAEIRKVAKTNPAQAAAGAVLFLEKVSPALEQVDGSSGAIGAAVNHAIEACAKIIAAAAVDDRTRDQWLDRLWEAHHNDEIPYIERLAEHWGELCASRERASVWADRLIGTAESVWSASRKPGGYFRGTIACLSALFHAGRHKELLTLLDKAPCLDVGLLDHGRQRLLGGGAGAPGTRGSSCLGAAWGFSARRCWPACPRHARGNRCDCSAVQGSSRHSRRRSAFRRRADRPRRTRPASVAAGLMKWDGRSRERA